MEENIIVTFSYSQCQPVVLYLIFISAWMKTYWAIKLAPENTTPTINNHKRSTRNTDCWSLSHYNTLSYLRTTQSGKRELKLALLQTEDGPAEFLHVIEDHHSYLLCCHDCSPYFRTSLTQRRAGNQQDPLHWQVNQKICKSSHCIT